MRAWIVVLSVLGILVTAGAARAEQRVALVIGNGAYKNMRLKNPADDARAMAQLLKKVGFDVIEGVDITQDQMKARLAEFGKKADGADLTVLYFAGQSFTVGGNNYLLPIDTTIKPADIAKVSLGETSFNLDQLTSLGDAMDQTMKHAKVKLVFFDASRIFPVGRIGVSAHTGSAGVESEQGTMIEFATGPGEVAFDGADGKHSPFTRALLANIAAPGMEIQQAMTRVRAQVNQETDKAQLPWGHTYLVNEVYLNPAPAAASPEKANEVKEAK